MLPQAGLPVPAIYWRSYGGTLLGLPVVLWILIAALAVVAFIARRPFQRHLTAVGGQRQAAFQTGIAVERIRIAAYVLSGLFSALAALCLIGETASGDPLLGQRLALASVVGGRARRHRAEPAAPAGRSARCSARWSLGMIGNVIFFAGLPFEYQTLVQGLIVLAALAGGVLVARR